MTEPDTTEVTINASDLIGDFVEKYELLIRPLLKQGDIRTPEPAILELCIRFSMAEESHVHYPHPEVYASYRMALGYLRGLSEPEAPRLMESERNKESYLACLDRQVSMLDSAMSSLGGERYQQYRERFKKQIIPNVRN